MLNLFTLLILSTILILMYISSIYSLPIGSCTPNHCPQDYYESNVICNNGSCYVNCSYYSGCDTNFTTIHTDSEYLPDLNIPSYSGAWIKDFDIGSYTPVKSDKCYRFRQTSPNNFVSSSNIGYPGSSGKGIALYWIDDNNNSLWYNNQKYFTWGDNSDYLYEFSTGAVWIDSCIDYTNNFNTADTYINTNSLYCAPDKKACDNLNLSYCDSDCYNQETKLRLILDTELGTGRSCNNFNDFVNTGMSGDAEIDYVNFSAQTVYMYVDESNAILNDSFNNSCDYMPQCNPADPCCDSGGNFRPNGFVCKNAHDAICNDAASCNGTAHEDRCTGTSSDCPDNNHNITYNEACNDLVCGNQSCSGSTFQPQRSCNSGTCQINNAYECPNNLNCFNSISCKKYANSSSDCKTGYYFDNISNICYSNESGIPTRMFYDQNGNLISDSIFNYTYNDFNELINVKNSNGNIVAEYFYDSNSNRIKKIEYIGNNNETTYYFDNFVQIVNSSGIFNESYFYYYDKLIGKKDNNGNISYYHPDQLGSTTLITDSNGNIVSNLQYEPFGNQIQNSNERYTYTGHEYDNESSLIYAGARYYNPQIGKFIQPDIITTDVNNPQSLNRYSYVNNNPFGYKDPNGMAMVGIGWIFSGIYVPVSIQGLYGSISGNFYLIHDDSKYPNDLSNGWHIGEYWQPLSGGIGITDSSSGMAALAFSFSYDINTPKDLSGPSITGGGSFGRGLAAGGDVSYSSEKKSLGTVEFGIGKGIEGHGGVSNTNVINLWDQKDSNPLISKSSISSNQKTSPLSKNPFSYSKYQSNSYITNDNSVSVYNGNNIYVSGNTGVVVDNTYSSQTSGLRDPYSYILSTLYGSYLPLIKYSLLKNGGID